jgi:hypothetical protein
LHQRRRDSYGTLTLRIRRMARVPQREELRSTYARSFASSAEERRLIGAVSFATTFGLTRLITHAIRDGRGPFRNITPGGRHVHHMTFGICGLLAVGWAWLNEFGIGSGGPAASRATAFVYGAGSALTLDEFALWLNLQDDYWNRQGRESIDAVVAFGSLLAIAASGHRAVAEFARLGRRVLQESP